MSLSTIVKNKSTSKETKRTTKTKKVKNETKNNNTPKYFNKTIYNNCVLSNLKEGMNTSATGAVRFACRGKAENPSIFDRLWYSW